MSALHRNPGITAKAVETLEKYLRLVPDPTARGAALRIARLSGDYLSLTGESVQPFTTTEKREAPALFKAQGKYFLISSGATYWSPNAAKYAVSDSVLGHYTIIGNPTYGDGAATTYNSLTTSRTPATPRTLLIA